MTSLRYLTDAVLFAPAADDWAKDRGLLDTDGTLSVLSRNANLGDLTDKAQARVSLGLRLGTDVQPYSTTLSALAASAAPTALALSLLTKTTTEEYRDAIGAGTVKSVTVSGGSTGLVFINGTITSTGTTTLSGVLGVSNGGTGSSTLADFKSSLGLNLVENTPDVFKPISNATQAALDGKYDKPLGGTTDYIRGDGTLAPFPNIPAQGIGTVTSVAMSGGGTGLVFTGGPITGSGTFSLTGTLSAANGGTGVTSLSALKSALSLDQVNNTSDAAKPISTAVQSALSAKVNVPASFAAGSTLTLPSPVANRVLMWDSTGSTLVNFDASVYARKSYTKIFTGDGVTVNFDLDYTPSSLDDISVTLGGVQQYPGASLDYVWDGDKRITMSGTFPSTLKLMIRYSTGYDIGNTALLNSIVDPLKSASTQMQAFVGADLTQVTSAPIGDMFTTGSFSSSTNIYLSKPCTSGAVLTSISVAINGGGTGVLMVFVPLSDGTYKVALTMNVTAVNGQNTWSVTNRYFPAGFRVGYKRLTGGTPLFSAGGSVVTPYVVATSAVNEGDITPVPSVTTITMPITYTVTASPSPLSQQIANNTTAIATQKSSLDALIAAIYPNTMTLGDATASAATASASYYWGTTPFTNGGILKRVRVQTVTGGIGKIVAAQVSGSNIVVLKSWTVTTTGGAVDTFDSTTFGTYFIPENVSIFFVPVTAGVLRYVSGGSAYRIATGSTVTDGSVVPFTILASATLSIDATVAYATSSGSNITTRPSDKSLTLERQVFAGTTAPALWNVSNWSWNNGLTATGSGWNAQATVNLPSCMASHKTHVKIKLNQATDKVGAIINCSRLFTNTTNSYGGVGVIINGETNALEIYKIDAANVATLAESVTLPAGFLVAGETYVIDMVKVRLTMSAKLTRSLTQESVSWSRVYLQTSDIRDDIRFLGMPGVVNLAGTSSVTEFNFSGTCRPQPWVMIVGDSICEGSAMGVATSNWQNNWCYQLDNNRNRGDVLISARGGDTTTGFIAHMVADLTMWRPKYVVIQIGTNDSDQNTWRTNVGVIINAALAVGAIPILCTYIPRTGIAGKQAQLTAMNADVMNGYFGRYDYIDFAAAMSLNHDRVTINTALYSDASVHQNIAGANAMYAQMVNDVPALLD